MRFAAVSAALNAMNDHPRVNHALIVHRVAAYQDGGVIDASMGTAPRTNK
jgi:hypothetical protein